MGPYVEVKEKWTRSRHSEKQTTNPEFVSISLQRKVDEQSLLCPFFAAGSSTDLGAHSEPPIGQLYRMKKAIID
jgi:hypothetical protein